MAQNLAVMITQCIPLLEESFKTYGETEETQWDVFEIPNDNKQCMNTLEYYCFKNNIAGRKRKFYQSLREKFLKKAKEYKRIVFIDLFWDGEYFIDEQVADCLQGKDCRLYFVDPMSELKEEFAYWDVFSKISSLEYRDMSVYGASRGLQVEFLPLGTRYYLYDHDTDGLERGKYDFCFVGIGTAERVRYLERVAQFAFENQLKFFVAGHFWHNSNWLSNLVGKLKFAHKHPYLSKYVVNKYVSSTDLWDLYFETKICLNANTPGHYTFNTRCLDILCCGGTVLTEREDSRGFLLEEDRHFYACDSPEDMVQKLKVLLSEYNNINLMISEGKEIVRREYTFKNNIKDFLS